jgi:uncharacterized protein YndB with AHSA1/START domain
MNHQPIVVKRIFDAPVSRLWIALTDKDEMKKWYFDLAAFNAEVGFKFEFTGGPGPDRQYRHLCEITAVNENKKLGYSWRYDGYDGISYVCFDLIDLGNQTLLTLTHEGLESFPASNADFGVNNFLEGWNHIINTSLQEYIDANIIPA